MEHSDNDANKINLGCVKNSQFVFHGLVMHVLSPEPPEAPSLPADLSVPAGDFGEGVGSDMHENCPCSEPVISTAKVRTNNSVSVNIA